MFALSFSLLLPPRKTSSSLSCDMIHAHQDRRGICRGPGTFRFAFLFPRLDRIGRVVLPLCWASGISVVFSALSRHVTLVSRNSRAPGISFTASILAFRRSVVISYPGAFHGSAFASAAAFIYRYGSRSADQISVSCLATAENNLSIWIFNFSIAARRPSSLSRERFVAVTRTRGHLDSIEDCMG